MNVDKEIALEKLANAKDMVLTFMMAIELAEMAVNELDDEEDENN